MEGQFGGTVSRETIRRDCSRRQLGGTTWRDCSEGPFVETLRRDRLERPFRGTVWRDCWGERLERLLGGTVRREISERLFGGIARRNRSGTVRRDYWEGPFGENLSVGPLEETLPRDRSERSLGETVRRDRSLAHSGDTLGILREHTKSIQRALRDHSDIAQRSLRDYSENTQRTPTSLHWLCKPTSLDVVS